MLINVFNGAVTFPSGAIEPRMERQAFLSSPIGTSAVKVTENDGYVTLHFKPEPGVVASALFKDNRLERLFFLMAIPSDETGEWTEARELERMTLHDNWLRQELGKPPYDYAWGSVTSEYDGKGCESDIVVVYGK